MRAAFAASSAKTASSLERFMANGDDESMKTVRNAD